MHEVANINLATPRRSSGGVTREEKRWRLEKKCTGQTANSFLCLPSQNCQAIGDGHFFPLGRTFRELAKCYFLPSELYQTLGDARTMPYTIL